MSLSLQNSTKVALDGKMRGYWLFRTSASSEQEIGGIRIVTEGCTGLSAVKIAIQQTIVSRRRDEVGDDRRDPEDRARDKTCSAGENFQSLSGGEESVSETDLESLDEQDLWYATDDNAVQGAMIGLRDALPRDMAGDHHRMIDPAEAEGSQNNQLKKEVIERPRQGQRQRSESQV